MSTDAPAPSMPIVQFQLPTSNVVAPPVLRSPVLDHIGQLAENSDSRSGLSCFALLDPQGQEGAKAEAAKLLPQMLDNTELFLSFGSEAVETLNQLFDVILKEIEPTDSAELKALMRKLNDRMREAKDNYDVTDPKVREQFEKWSNGVRGLFRRGKTMIDMLLEDIRSIEGNLDKIIDSVNAKERQMLDNIGIYDRLYYTNEAEIQKLISFIAIMEAVRDLAAEQAEAIKVDPTDQQERPALERKRLLAEFSINMDIRVAEFKNRLFVAFSTAPQVTNMRTLDVGLATKLRTLTMLVIPSMKGQLIQWRTMLQALEGAEMEQAIAESANEWILGFANEGAITMPMIAEAVHKPTLAISTITGVANAIQQQATGIISALEAGGEQRQLSSVAIANAQVAMQKSADGVSDAIVDQVLKKSSEHVPEVDAIVAEATA